MKLIKINVVLSEPEALALAQFIKRTGFTDYREKAVSETEAYVMQNAGEMVGRALAELGIKPR